MICTGEVWIFYLGSQSEMSSTHKLPHTASLSLISNQLSVTGDYNLHPFQMITLYDANKCLPLILLDAKTVCSVRLYRIWTCSIFHLHVTAVTIGCKHLQ